MVRQLLRVIGARLLALDGTHAWSCRICLLRLSLLLQEVLSVQEIVWLRGHKLVRETCGAMLLHGELLVGLMKVLLGSLLLQVRRMLLLLLL